MSSLPADLIERARAAARRVDELEDVARQRDAWLREVDRLEPEVRAAQDHVEKAVVEAERAAETARASRGVLGALRDRLAGHLKEGRDERLARASAEESATGAKRLAAEALLRRVEGELEDARRKLLLADGAAGSLAGARATERKLFLQMGATGDGEMDGLISELAGQDRRAEAWRSALRAAGSRRDHASAALAGLTGFRDGWPELRERPGDVMHGAGGTPPPVAVESLKRARHELYLAARAGVAGLDKGVLADFVTIPAHEIDRPATIRRVAAVLTRAIQELEPIAGAAEKNAGDLERNLESADANCEQLRARLHARLFPR